MPGEKSTSLFRELSRRRIWDPLVAFARATLEASGSIAQHAMKVLEPANEGGN